MNIRQYSFVIVAGYLLGSIPTGFLVGKIRGIDVRTAGSGNIGATNAFRILGPAAGVLVLLIDAAKGYVAAILPLIVMRSWGSPPCLPLAGGVAAILGHNYTCWLRFKGGKGIATTGGVVLAWAPGACLTAVAAWLLALGVTRYVSIASICAAAVLPFAVWFFNGNGTMVAVVTILSLLAIYKHKSNIQRLLAGTENRLGKKKA